jgi:hypothetical protein
MGSESQIKSLDCFLGLDSFHIRLTLKSDLDTIQKFIEKSITTKYILCDELTHYHCYAVTQKLKKEIVVAIKSELKLKGNADFSVIKVKNKNQMKKYIMKDGNFIYKNFDEKEINILRKLSFKKGIDKLQTELEKYEQQLYEKEITFTRFAELYIKLKIDYNQNIYGNHIKAYLTKIKMKNDPTYIKEYVSELMR